MTQSGSKKAKAVSFRVPDSLDRAVAALARRRGQSKSAFVRETLTAFIQAKGKAEGLTCLDLMGDLAGRFSGPKDLSNKKKHLKGFGR